LLKINTGGWVLIECSRGAIIRAGTTGIIFLERVLRNSVDMEVIETISKRNRKLAFHHVHQW